MAAPAVEQQADRNYTSPDDPLPSSHASPSPNQKSPYAALFDDIPSTPPDWGLHLFGLSQPKHPGLTDTSTLPDYESLRDDYERLREEWNTISTDFDERMKWLDDLEEHHDHINAHKFVTWMRENPEPRLIQAKSVINTVFVRLLRKVDWIQNNEDLGTVNERLWSRHISIEPNLYVGRYKDTVLKLRLNGRALNPPKADIATCKSYGITSVYQRSLLAIRYKPLGEEDHSKRVFLFVTLGKLIYMCLQTK
ncbi:uncharacterized protein K444DRAFT_224304 [Hyaloscypha bicolor E]|uniref:Uncharacterized protein n=1 Tax=Hyaloscypha bicolor E TaxID=1095630 RepID=A0A2J6SJZ0_9HELO|nr:uncharacterized protein K444DRAFT_224304 [Hyaloscypha bicolor E]PMD51077.1 hypothetical protein K444DRAFT_224304 [Hyaloscypha bicolor E]